LHHGNTQLILKDPDAFPTLSVYKRSKFMRVVFELAPGSKNLLSYFYFFYWFSFQAFLNQAHHRFGHKMWATMNHKRVTWEFILVCLMAAAWSLAASLTKAKYRLKKQMANVKAKGEAMGDSLKPRQARRARLRQAPLLLVRKSGGAKGHGLKRRRTTCTSIVSMRFGSRWQLRECMQGRIR
jgi:hypothetical protein